VQVQEAELLDLLQDTNDIAPNKAMTAIGKSFFIKGCFYFSSAQK